MDIHNRLLWLPWLPVALIAAAGGCSSAPEAKDEPLVIYCAASNQAVMEAIRRDYTTATGVPLMVQYGASQTLLANAKIAGGGDVYLPADDGYIDIARQEGLAGEVFPLATMQAVVAVQRGNPKNIRTWNDLLRPEVRLTQASPDAAAIGKLTRDVLTKAGPASGNLWEALDRQTTVYAANVTEAANSLKLGSVDAAILYDAMLHDYATLEAVALPELSEVRAKVAATVLKTSRQPDRAAAFARYLAAPDKGQVRYREFGFQPAGAKAGN